MIRKFADCIDKVVIMEQEGFDKGIDRVFYGLLDGLKLAPEPYKRLQEEAKELGVQIPEAYLSRFEKAKQLGEQLRQNKEVQYPKGVQDVVTELIGFPEPCYENAQRILNKSDDPAYNTRLVKYIIIRFRALNFNQLVRSNENILNYLAELEWLEQPTKNFDQIKMRLYQNARNEFNPILNWLDNCIRKIEAKERDASEMYMRYLESGSPR